MIWLQALLLTLGLVPGLLLAGYWLAAAMREASPAERLAGVGSLLFMVGAVNFFVPLRGLAAWVCVLLPCGLSLRAKSRRTLAGDCRQVFRRPGAWWAALGAATFWTALLWPLLSDPQMVFYDGSGNHDNFFWIAGAEHLGRYPYMAAPVPSEGRPFANLADVIVGWRPIWGRMGAEGLLALGASTTGRSPLEFYLAGTAALLLPWLGGVFLVLRTFVLTGQPRAWGWGAVAGLQPVFAFFHRNGNLPNLLGALMAATLLLGLARGPGRMGGEPPCASPGWPGVGLMVLGTHGLLCAYPEMLPFALLPVGLLGVRAWRGSGGRPVAVMAGALAAGFLVNPATGVRGLVGFVVSFHGARADEHWFNLFSVLRPAGYVPALTTLAIPACARLGPAAGLALSLGLVAMLALTVRRARDPFGTGVLLTGAGVLLLYTLLTGFSYGWQKTTQFGGVFVAALFPAGGLAILDGMAARGPGRSRALAAAAAGVLLVFFARATEDSFESTRYWASRKRITRDLLSLRETSSGRLRGASVLVVGESFPQPFFYGMWATYLLPDSELMFSTARDESPGGYLSGGARREVPGETPVPAAVFVGRAWAETFDAGSPRLGAGTDFALLTETNRVLEMTGFDPDVGVPKTLAASAGLRLLPPHDAWLHLTLRPRGPLPARALRLVVQNQVAGEAAVVTRPGPVEGPPWDVALPLRGGVVNAVTIGFAGAGSLDPGDKRAFQVAALRITRSP